VEESGGEREREGSVTRCLAVLVLAGVFLSACSSPSGEVKDGEKEGLGAQCEFAGTWSRCESYGSSSTSVVLVADGLRISETINDFDSNADCQGSPVSSMSFTADYVMGQRGESAAVAGGTDVEMNHIAPDLFGCGDQPTYTVIELNSSCTEFRASSDSPSCDSDHRGTSFDLHPFIRSHPVQN
jgi:hypothetical protein